ncbi:chromosome segregation protein SMC [Facklamia sp. DSM 111018]|uniref:Chromosome partition protein Smc n=1 Tax=Facklamia lactis TaxID=2749967 RepID=A0ABS0LMX6_9LACT|nr:chromosome segregation protein SMC [Facklamia lactis]MBG9985506.1 chromosome segregation protein SMC [Facklamia lactis]
MYLEKVEMTGFKSFADKTVITFDRGLTAVVGPNGSGKSNLSEAIRWVLGEQSAKSLRGNKMEDVIFNGSQERKPVNVAKVTLVLNNEDHYFNYDRKQVTITRQYNRKGESTYLINNEVVRLKDVTDLLLDTGIGKNSFAMISQGKVESIFLSKPEERRGIFEEAAGVQKYQHRKQEAQRKLSRSQEHLNRVKDILFELEGQIAPLKEQRETALIYQEKIQLLQEHEIAYYTYQIDQSKKVWQKAQEDLGTVQEQLQKLNQEQNDHHQQLTHSQEELDQLNDQLDRLVETVQQDSQTIERQRGEYHVIQQKIEYATQSSKEREKSQANWQEKIATNQYELEQVQQQGKVITDNIQQVETTLHQSKEQIQALSEMNPEALEELRADMIEEYRQESNVKNQLQQMEETIQNYHKKSQNFQDQIDRIDAQLQEINPERLEKQNEISRLETDLTLLQKESQQSQNQLEVIIEQKKQLQKQIYQEEHPLRILESKYHSLEQMRNDYSGYYQGVRAVMNHRQSLRGIDGTVADLIQVDSEFQTAIDIALGAGLQNIIVEDDQAAKEAIQYLRQEGAGRATFLPRSNIKGRFLRQDHLEVLRSHPSYLGIASERVAVSEKYQSVIQQLLGTTAIVEDLHTAQLLAKQVHQQVKIVTLQGDVIMPGGAVTGGRVQKKQPSMLARQNQLDQVKKELEEAQAHYQVLVQKHQEIEIQVSQAEEVAFQNNQKVQNTYQFLTNLRAQYQELDQRYQQLTQQKLILEDDLHQLTDNFQESQQNFKEAQDKLAHIQEKIASLNETIKHYQLNQTDRDQQVLALQEQYNEARTQLAVLKLELKQNHSKEEELCDDIYRLQSNIENNQSQEINKREELEALQAEGTMIQQNLSELEQVLTKNQVQLEEARQIRQTLNDTIRQTQAKNRDFEAKLQDLYQKEGKLEAKVEKYGSLIDQYLSYLSENYQLSYEAAVKASQPGDEVPNRQNLIKQLRQEIDRLGPINIAAIEDYQLLHDRFVHLKEQETDLLEAMAQLNQTIDEMDEEVSTRFKEAFQAINVQFQKTFVRLFGGGRAQLELTDPSDLLTTGVDITAQPPGKRKQNLALLSGGERALTAIALLFAILETKAVPFVVLDEVEAALDDANVYRYGEYIHNFTEKTQFIVITHRKGTMEYADVLYGVTMEQTGISKLASVQLKEAQGITE